MRVIKTCFLPKKAGLTAFTALDQHQRNRVIRPVTKQADLFRLQLDSGSTGAYLGEFFRPVHQKKVTAVFQRPSGGTE